MRHFQSRVRWPRAGGTPRHVWFIAFLAAHSTTPYVLAHIFLVEGVGSGTTRKESERKAYEDLAVRLERLVGIAFDKDASTDPRPQSPPYGSRFGALSSKASPYSMPRAAPRKHWKDVFPGVKVHSRELLELLDDSARYGRTDRSLAVLC